jgi:hypothetical protein
MNYIIKIYKTIIYYYNNTIIYYYNKTIIYYNKYLIFAILCYFV